MPRTVPPPDVTITRQQARRFLLAHLRLLPPRTLVGAQGALELLAALQDCLRQFCSYLGAESLTLGAKPKRDAVLKEMARAVSHPTSPGGRSAGGRRGVKSI